MIIGSANINDRSMLGSRDHEVGVVISQTEADDLVELVVNDKKMRVSKAVHQFRTQLMMEHFGLPYEGVKDPIKNRELLTHTADSNSKLYFDIFQCEPDDCIRTFEKLEEVRKLRTSSQEDVHGFTQRYMTLKD